MRRLHGLANRDSHRRRCLDGLSRGAVWRRPVGTCGRTELGARRRPELRSPVRRILQAIARWILALRRCPRWLERSQPVLLCAGRDALTLLALAATRWQALTRLTHTTTRLEALGSWDARTLEAALARQAGHLTR
jgi:hypothetical protein